MPVYNNVKYIDAAVNSIIYQNYDNFELLIIDDGSTDGSKRKLKKYSKKYSEINLISRKNKGLIKTLNEGLMKSEGEYIARMDSDDISMPNRLRKQANFLDENRQCVLVGSQSIIIDDNGNRASQSDTYLNVEKETGKMRGIWEYHNQIMMSLLVGGWPLVHPSVMMRKKAVLEAGCYNKRFENLEDHDLFLRLSRIGELRNLTDINFKYRRHNGQITSNKSYTTKYYKIKLRRRAYKKRDINIPSEISFQSLVSSFIVMIFDELINYIKYNF